MLKRRSSTGRVETQTGTPPPSACSAAPGCELLGDGVRCATWEDANGEWHCTVPISRPRLLNQGKRAPLQVLEPARSILKLCATAVNTVAVWSLRRRWMTESWSVKAGVPRITQLVPPARICKVRDPGKHLSLCAIRVSGQQAKPEMPLRSHLW